MFSQEEAHAASLEYFNGDELAADVFLGKYALRDDDKNLLEKTPDDMHRRLAREFARIESKYANAMSEEKIFDLFKGFKYVIPQGSPMSSIGNDYQIQSHSNCFVLPNLHNSYGSIFYTDQQQAQIMKRRGGVGFDISNIRPKGMKTRNAAGTTDGIAPFMDRFSNTCREVAQCIAAGEKVLTKRGLIPIEKVIPNKDYAWTRKGWIKVINLFHNGQKDIYRVSTKDGLEIRTSADHIFLTETDGELIEKRVRDFSVGEKAVLLPGPTKSHRVSTNLTRHTNFPTKLNTDLSYLLGITYGDGCVRNYTSRKTGETYPVGIEICCSHEWPTIVDRIGETVKKLFDHEISFYHEGNKKATDVRINSKEIISWLKINNLLKEKCSDISIPSAILKSSQSNQMAFLAGLLDSDGCASSGEYSWTTTSEVASKQIQIILMANGIYSKRSQQKEINLQKAHFKRGFKIRVYGRYGQILLRKLMGPYSEKVSTSDYTSTRDHQQTPFRALSTPTSERYLNATEFLEAKAARPEMYDTELLLTSEISSIEPVGMEETYDLGLESEHLFWCQGFYVHNSGRRGALMLTIDCHHPEIETFINIKRDLKRVTGANISVRWSDEFLEAVESGGEVEMRWPVEKDSERQISKMVNARDIWESFVSSAHASGDPGCLFWDTALRRTPSDCYAEDGFKSVSTNPCLTYETKVAVADGRGAVEIGKLAEEGKDIPVFALDERGNMCVKTMRHPRKTGHNLPVYKVIVEGGHSFRATGNHKVMVNDKGYIEVKDLISGDSLQTTIRKDASIKDVFPKTNAKSQDYFWWKSPDKNTLKSDHRLIWEAQNGPIPKHHVIHHIDFNAKNNSIENLRCMSVKEHDALHADQMRGENNPIHKIKKDPAKWEHYIQAQSEAQSGERNGRYSGKTHDDLKLHAIKLTKATGQRFSTNQWLDYAKANNLPMAFSKWRKEEFGSPIDLSKWAAMECGLEFIDEDPRLVKTIVSMRDQGYKTKVINNGICNTVAVNKNCETCGNEFYVESNRREASFCSKECSKKYLDADNFESKEIYANRKKGRRLFNLGKAAKTKEGQLSIYTGLKFKLGRQPLMEEWKEGCKAVGLPCRVGRVIKYGFKSYKEVVAEGNDFNHRVISVELDGREDVYNGTVDDLHMFLFGGFEEKQESGKKKIIYFNNRQCGEIVLSGNYDSCRLLCINTLSYVKNPFTKSATFDVELFIQHAREAQRLMDDLIDLEIEAIQKILDKVDSDPEPPYIKQIEKELWEAALATAKAGRRTGLGVTAVGDTIAACGLRYGSAESIEMTEMIYANLALAAYRTTVDLAAERGAFPIFDFKKEEGHPLLEQIWARDPVLFEDYKKHGRRNIALTTTAPTGSVSVMTQTTSGIEPVFMTHYKRRKKINPNDTSLRVDFTDDLGDKWQEYTVYHHGVKAWMDATGETDIAKSPYAGATANEIDWESAVNLQAAAQKWICHAISKTINLPNEATTEDVQKVYWRGWKAGCKGVTVYRDGSKSGVLVADTPNEKRTADGRPIEIVSSHAPKRPETLDCEIHNVKIGGNQWIVLVGLLKGRPYELFAGKAENLVLPKKSKGGKLIKIRRGVYDLHIGEDDDELIVKNVIKAFDNPEMAWTTRLISMALRHGIDCSYVQMQLDKDGLIADINKVLARVIKKYIVDGKKATGVACKACGSANVVFAEGCLTCVDCGSSKCG